MRNGLSVPYNHVEVETCVPKSVNQFAVGNLLIAFEVSVVSNCFLNVYLSVISLYICSVLTLFSNGFKD